MGYPKYDKEEARRVYEEGLKNYKPEASTGVGGLLFVFGGAIVVVGLIALISAFVDKAPHNAPIFKNEAIVIDTFSLTHGKRQDFIVKYHTVENIRCGEFITEDIYYNIGDTIMKSVEQPKED